MDYDKTIIGNYHNATTTTRVVKKWQKKSLFTTALGKGGREECRGGYIFYKKKQITSGSALKAGCKKIDFKKVYFCSPKRCYLVYSFPFLPPFFVTTTSGGASSSLYKKNE